MIFFDQNLVLALQLKYLIHVTFHIVFQAQKISFHFDLLGVTLKPITDFLIYMVIESFLNYLHFSKIQYFTLIYA